MRVLGIESSCDETAASVVDNNRILSNVIHTQIAIHNQYGGVVPELASRNHIVHILDVVERALSEANTVFSDLDGIAVTQGPGLVGSLIVGLETAKALAYSRGLPLCGIHHVEAHITAIFLQQAEVQPKIPSFPYIALAVSGGHTSLYRVDAIGAYRRLGTTRDDAAGEAFDKVAKMLELGYPGGVAIDRLARNGDPKAIQFPRPMLHRGLEFSFSGIKTSVRYHLRKLPAIPEGQQLCDLAASFQESVVDVLLKKTLRAAKQENIEHIVLAGGVAANSRLRARFNAACENRTMEVFCTPLSLCTDNAAMIAGLGQHYIEQAPPFLSLNAYANLPI